MEQVAPLGPVYQAGTLSGNPLAMRAGLATLPKLEAPGFYEDVNRKTQRLADGFRSALKDANVHGQVESPRVLCSPCFSTTSRFAITQTQKIELRTLRYVLSRNA